MRQIKFRAWNKERKFMFQVYRLYFDKRTREALREEDGDILMQFTGLYDKNGVEIYEGDVLDFTVWDAWDNDTQYIGVVKFEQGEWQIWNSEQSEFYDADGAFHLFWVHENDTEIKVIGNVYETPELPEVGR